MTSFDDVCDAVARVGNDLNEWRRQFDVKSPASASIENRFGRQVVIEGLTVMLEELTSALFAYVDEGVA